MSKPDKKTLDVKAIIKQFKEAEKRHGHRKDAFKIEGSFEDAVRKIAKAKPEPRKRKAKNDK